MGTPLPSKKHDGEKVNADSRNIPPPADEGNMCSICQDTEISTAMYALPCAHKFHEQCINEWLKTKLVCPICRLRIGGHNGDESFSDEFLVLDSSSPIRVQTRVEFFGSDGDGELLVESSSDLSNSFSVNIYADTSDLYESGRSDHDTNNSESDAEQETFEFEMEQETTESEQGTTESEQESSDSDEEPGVNESVEESEMSEIDSGSETSESSEESEISVSESDYESYSE